MIFVSLGKMRRKPDKEMAGDATKIVAEFKEKGINVLNWYWTLGQYDVVFIFEAANEKDALKVALDISQFVSSETLVAIPRQEAISLL